MINFFIPSYLNLIEQRCMEIESQLINSNSKLQSESAEKTELKRKNDELGKYNYREFP